MTTLTVQAIIQGVDRLTGPLAGMAGKLTGIQNQLNAAGMAATNFGLLTTGAFTAPLTALSTFSLAGQEDLDRALRDFQVVGAATAEQRKQLRDLSMEIGPRLGIPQLELISGAKELIQAGLMPDDLFTKGEKGISLLERLAGGAKVGSEKIGSLATQLLILAQSFKLPFETSADKASALEKVMGLAIAAPRFSPDSPRGHMEALRQFGPLIAPLGVDMNEASALQSVLAKSFPGALGGMGLKTIFQRLMNPTVAAQQQMMLGGFNFGRVFGFDPAKLSSADELIKSLRAGGVDASKAKSYLTQMLGTLTPDTDMLGFKGDLAAGLGDELGLKKGDSRNRGLLKRGIDNFFTLANGKLDVEAFLEEMSKMSPAALKDLAGLHHAPKSAVLQGKDALAEYRRILELNKVIGPKALDEGLAVKTEGWAFSLERARGALTSLQSAIWEAGSGSMWTTIMDKIGDGLLKLATIDPKVLGGIATGLGALALAGAGLTGAGLAVQTMAFGLGGLMMAGSRLMAMPLWAKAIAAGGLAALLFGSMTNAFQGSDPWGYGMAANSQAGPAVAAFEQLTRLVGNIGGLVGDAGSAMGKLFGLNFDDSPLVKSLTYVTSALRQANDWVESQRSGPSILDKLGKGIENNVPAAPAWWYRLLGREPQADPQQSSLGGSIGGAVQPIAKLEGHGEVTVHVKVDGGRLSGLQVGDDGRHIKMKSGTSMSDSGSPVD